MAKTATMTPVDDAIARVQVASQAVEAAEAILEGIRVQGGRWASERRTAILEGDADAAIEAQRRADEHGTRLLVAEVAVLRADLALARVEIDVAQAQCDESSAVYNDVKARRSRLSDKEYRSEAGRHIDVEFEAAARKARAAGARRQERQTEVQRIEKAIAAKVHEAGRVLAPIVRSIPHMPSQDASWGD